MTTVKPAICPACGRAMFRKRTSLDDPTHPQCARCHDRWMEHEPNAWPASSVFAVVAVLIGLLAVLLIGIFMMRSTTSRSAIAPAQQIMPTVVPAPAPPTLTPIESLITSADHFYTFSERSLSTSGGVWLAENELSKRVSGVLHDCEFTKEPDIGTVVRFVRPSSFVDIPGSEAEHPAQFTLCAWVKITGDTDGSVIDKADWRDGGTRGFGLRIIRQRANVFVGQDTWMGLDTLQELPTKKWMHIAATYDGQALKLYVNGVMDNSRTVLAPYNNSNYRMHIGNATYEEGHDRFLPGYLRDAGIFYRPLTADEIKLLMNRDPR